MISRHDHRRSKIRSRQAEENRLSDFVGLEFDLAESNEPDCVCSLLNNRDRRSRWGGIDIDAHEPTDADRAQKLAFDAFRFLLNEDFLILESSGRGWHLWVISEEFLPLYAWLKN